ncbi:OmpA family protein [Runella sp.]|uniref:OmpA family protein n=1 Tax=Runella sp. TaxID=1960881 RepID=UPI003D0EF543
MKKVFIFCLFSSLWISQINAQDLKAYQNYDFVAGDKLIFADDFSKDKDGEFPSRWKLIEGQGVINTQNDEKYMAVTKYYTVISPRLKTPTYLPANYTVEFDCYLDAGYDSNPGIMLGFMKGDEVAVLIPDRAQVTFSYPGGNLTGEMPADILNELFFDKWNHIAVAAKDNQLKVYVNQHRVLSVPEVGFAATSLTIKGNASDGKKMFFKNFRLAEGGDMNLIDKALTDGKFITSAILFDVNKATLKRESMGVLNEVAKFMKANASAKFEVGGYTDADGDDAANLTLSQKRADTVKNQLVSMGIDASRLSPKGYGEAKPIADNAIPEGKAKNRRVEFVKM